MLATKRQRGFGLAETVMALAIAAFALSITAPCVLWLYSSYVSLRSREALASNADQALRRLGRDLHRAVPNSLRSDGNAIEFMHIADGARYRGADGSNPDGSVHTNQFLASPTSGFNLTGRLHNLSFSYGSPLPSGSRLLLAPNSVTALWAELASAANPATVTPASTSITITADGTEEHLALSASHQFSQSSAAQRLYLSDGPMQYRCIGGQLRRYAGYAASATLAVPTGASALLAEGVGSCNFAVINASDGSTPLLAELTLTLSNSAGETLSLLHQVGGLNLP